MPRGSGSRLAPRTSGCCLARTRGSWSPWLPMAAAHCRCRRPAGSGPCRPGRSTDRTAGLSPLGHHRGEISPQLLRLMTCCNLLAPIATARSGLSRRCPSRAGRPGSWDEREAPLAERERLTNKERRAQGREEPKRKEAAAAAKARRDRLRNRAITSAVALLVGVVVFQAVRPDPKSTRPSSSTSRRPRTPRTTPSAS